MDITNALTFDGLKYFYTKYIKPLKTGAFSTVVNNATTTVANTVLDGRMGKTLADKDANLQSQINTLNSSLENLKYYEYKLSSGDYYYEKDICFYKSLGTVTVYDFGIKMKVNTQHNVYTTIGYIPEHYVPGADLNFPVMNGNTGEYIGMMQLSHQGAIRLCPIVDVARMELFFSVSYSNYS